MRFINRRNVGVAAVAVGAAWLAACGAEAPAQALGDENHGVDESAAMALELTGTFPESFGLVTNVRELDDGTLLVADPLSKVLLHLDMDNGSVDTIGSEGAGPDEYRQPDAVFALDGGRTFLVDLGNARFTILESDQQFGQTYPMASGTPGPGGNFEMKLAEAVDLAGRVYYRGRLMSFGGEPPTHAPIRRWDPNTDGLDDVAEIALPEVKIERSGGPGNQNVSMRAIPMAPEDEWDVSGDGRIAVARHAPYRVEWIETDGTVTTGPEVSYDAVAIGTDEKLEFQERRSESGGGLSISMEDNNGQIRMSMQRGGPEAADRSRVEDLNWPEVKPPFESILVASNGTAWVRRSREAGANPLYDVFDDRGRRTGAVELEGRRRIVTFTDESVYVVHMDEFDLQHLERYRLPS